jgi:hypothetical protein
VSLAVTVLAGAVLAAGMAATDEPRPPRPRARVAVLPATAQENRRATFVLYDPVPGGAEQLAPDALSGASY